MYNIWARLQARAMCVWITALAIAVASPTCSVYKICIEIQSDFDSHIYTPALAAECGRNYLMERRHTSSSTGPIGFLFGGKLKNADGCYNYSLNVFCF